MREKEARRPVRVSRYPPLQQRRQSPLNGDLAQGMALYRRFNRFKPSRVKRTRHARIIPPVVVELGELAGLIYRSDKWQPGRPRTYIHFMQDPPRLASDVEGRQLYILGGSYRVTQRGIEG